MHILASVTAGREFAAADAINDLGAMAVVPRTVEETRDKNRKHVLTELPALRNYLFLAITEHQWHQVNKGLMIPTPSGQIKRIMVHAVDQIPSREWVRVQQFAQEIEMDYQHRMAEVEDRHWNAAHPGPRKYLAPYSIAEKLHLLGGDLQARFVRSLGTVDAPMIEAEVTMFGRPVTIKVHPDKVDKWAAE